MNLLIYLLFTTGFVLWRNVAWADETPELPWKPAYKIKPHETHRLTAADVVGPDGIVYPDWRYAGVPGGIPSAPERAHIQEFGGKADDDEDDSRALEEGAKMVAQRGGGALILGKGVYHLDRPVVITDSSVVIRGQGVDETKIVFRYNVPEGSVRFFRPREDEIIGPDTWIEAHAAPDGLRRIAIEADGKIVEEQNKRSHWNGGFLLRLLGSAVVNRADAFPRSEHNLKAIAEWKDGRSAETTMAVQVDPEYRAHGGRRYIPLHNVKNLAAIMFIGDSMSGDLWKLKQDGKRGDTEIVLETEPNLRQGDALLLYAPATPRWNRLVRNASKRGVYRRYEFRVEEVKGNRVRLNQPLRYDFPVVDGSTARKIYPIRRCGVENLTLEQTHKLWTSGILFASAWECWARSVRVIKAGRYPVYARQAKWCEIRDCVMDDAWYHGGGGTAYVGWDRTCDCLMENVTTYRMRHAPCVQWAASGNVIRKSVFHGSDAQWHAGWTNENLFEQCVIDAGGKTGSYGFGGWASPPNDTAHGPEGPRNVVYNCDIRSAKAGLSMGGMNENWLILYNRFIVGSGPGIQARTYSFDHIIRGNVIALAETDKPAIYLRTNDCTGIEVVDNHIYGGNGRLVDGKARLFVNQNNVFSPLTNDPPRPQPMVPSIFEWQRQKD